MLQVPYWFCSTYADFFTLAFAKRSFYYLYFNYDPIGVPREHASSNPSFRHTRLIRP